MISIGKITKYSVIPLTYTDKGKFVEYWELDATVVGNNIQVRKGSSKLTLYPVLTNIPIDYTQPLSIVKSVDEVIANISPDQHRFNTTLDFVVTGSDLYNKYKIYKDGVLYKPKKVLFEDQGEYDIVFTNTLDNKQRTFKHNLEVYKMIADDITLEVEYTKPLVGDVMIIRTKLKPEPEGVTYEWLKGSTVLDSKSSTLNILVKDETAGEYTVKASYTDETISIQKFTIDVHNGLYIGHVEDLSHRTSGAIQISTRELDLIDAYKKDGVDWRSKISVMKYNDSAVVIDRWLTEYPDSEIEVQESRNGRILNKDYFVTAV